MTLISSSMKVMRSSTIRKAIFKTATVSNIPLHMEISQWKLFGTLTTSLFKMMDIFKTTTLVNFYFPSRWKNSNFRIIKEQFSWNEQESGETSNGTFTLLGKNQRLAMHPPVYRVTR